MMAFVEKKTTIDKVHLSFRAARDAGIDTFAYFIIGYINETPKTMQATIDLAIDLDPRYVMFTKATPLPTTPLMRQSVEAGLVDPDYWKKYTLGEIQDPMRPLVSDADQWVEKAYRSFYLRKSKVVNQLLRIRSYDDLKKNVEGFFGIWKFKMNETTLSVQKGSDKFLQNDQKVTS